MICLGFNDSGVYSLAIESLRSTLRALILFCKYKVIRWNTLALSGAHRMSYYCCGDRSRFHEGHGNHRLVTHTYCELFGYIWLQIHIFTVIKVLVSS